MTRFQHPLIAVPPQPLTAESHEVAIEITRDRGSSAHDSLIVAAALRAGCSILYSEDLHHGQDIGQLTIRHPFIE